MKRIFASILSLAILGPSLTWAAGEFRLGVVDFQKALNSVEEGKTAKERLKKEFEGKQKDLETRKTKIDKLQTELADLQKQYQSGLLKPEVMEKGKKLENDFRKQFEEYTTLFQTNQKEMAEKEQKATSDILNKLRDQVADIGRAGQYTMIVEANESGLLYASAPTDLTEQVIQKYNSSHKGGSDKKK